MIDKKLTVGELMGQLKPILSEQVVEIMFENDAN